MPEITQGSARRQGSRSETPAAAAAHDFHGPQHPFHPCFHTGVRAEVHQKKKQQSINATFEEMPMPNHSRNNGANAISY